MSKDTSVRRPFFWLAWFVGNALWLLGLPYLYIRWLAAEVEAEYAAGIRTSSDGDSLGIPLAGFALINLAFVILVNAGWAAWTIVKRQRSRRPS